MELLNCTHNTLDATYAELTAAGYISRSARQGYGKQRAVSVASVQSPNFCASVAQNLHTSGPKIAYKPTSPINPYIAILLEPASAPRLTPPSRRHRSRKTQTMFWGCCSRVIRYVSSCVRRRCCTPTLQVLKEPGHSFSSKSYMWLYRTSGCVKQAVVLYEYQPTRKAEHADVFLQGFNDWCTRMGTKDTTSYPRIFEWLGAGPMHSEDLMRHCKRCPRRCKRTLRQ